MGHKPQPHPGLLLQHRQGDIWLFLVTGDDVLMHMLCFAVPAVPEPHQGPGGVLPKNQGGGTEV